jgi:quercetin dioxygenase-like cupin family protein
VVGNIDGVLSDAVVSGAAGAVWTLQATQRQLDANIIHLPTGDGIGEHHGPDVDVLLVVLNGSGELTTEAGAVVLSNGSVTWMPRRTRRAIAAGNDGLTYLTVHQRRPGLSIGKSSSRNQDH